MPLALDPQQFDAEVSRALDTIPPELADRIENCVVLVEDRPPADQPNLLGLYEGVPLTERGTGYAGLLPDRILIFREPLLAVCRDLGELNRQIHVTVVHEIAHFFGIDDQRLRELGYG